MNSIFEKSVRLQWFWSFSFETQCGSVDTTAGVLSDSVMLDRTALSSGVRWLLSRSLAEKRRPIKSVQWKRC